VDGLANGDLLLEVFPKYVSEELSKKKTRSGRRRVKFTLSGDKRKEVRPGRQKGNYYDEKKRNKNQQTPPTHKQTEKL